MPKTKNDLNFVVARTDRPMSCTDGSEYPIPEKALREWAARNGWKIEPVPGVPGHVQAVMTVKADLSIGNVSIGCDSPPPPPPDEPEAEFFAEGGVKPFFKRGV